MMNNSAGYKSREPVQKSNCFRWLVAIVSVSLLLVLVGVYTWRYLYNPCEVDAVKEASAFLNIQLKTYDGVYQVAATASRTAPDHPVNTLKQILMDTQEGVVPACMQTAKDELLNYMGTVILAFQAFRAGEADATVLDLIRQSDDQYDKFNAELKAINECAPYCIP